MIDRGDKKENSRHRINLFEKKETKRLSLDLHTMPKTETGHFQKWLVLGFLIFVLIILAILFFI